MRCTIWMKTEFAEVGLESKSEYDNNNIQNEANPQIIKICFNRT